METILLFRSGRHLRPAVSALRTAYQGCRVVVVTQPGTEAELAQAGVSNADAIFYHRGRFSPLGFLFSRAGWKAVRLRPRRVALLWNSSNGDGLSNVTLTAALVAPRTLIAVTADRHLVTVRWAHVRRCLENGLRVIVRPLAARWEALRERLEGPELEPPVWHSQYLPIALGRRDITPLGQTLQGLVLDIGAGTGYAARFLDASRTRYLPTDLPTMGRMPPLRNGA